MDVRAIAGYLMVGIVFASAAFIVTWNAKPHRLYVNFTTFDTQTNVRTEVVEYFEGTKGFLVGPVVPGTYPGIVMIHEKWGLNNNIKDMARRLASYGYNVLAVDLYGGRVASTPDSAAQLAEINETAALNNLNAAVAYLKKSSPRIGVVGWGFGGSQALLMNVDATVIYYANPENATTNTMGIFSQDIPAAAVEKFNQTNPAYVYKVNSGFADPASPNYSPANAEDAWQKTLDFLNLMRSND